MDAASAQRSKSDGRAVMWAWSRKRCPLTIPATILCLMSRLCLSVLLCVAPGLGAACQPSQADVVRALNHIRAAARHCGSVHGAAGAVTWDERLAASALAHAGEMAAQDEISHRGLSGGTLRQRLSAVAYPLATAGEALGGGPEALDEMLELWLSSPGHCETLMGPEYIHVGAACVAAPGRLQRYWVLQLAAPQRPRSSPDQSP